VPAVDKPNARVLGQPVRRIEDPALLTGQGRYVDDLAIPRCTTPARS
jgi:CO/xanthine dehydrogenase Mo-binding subunit